MAGIGRNYSPENLINKQIAIVANLEPRNLMAIESQGMLLAASDEQGICIVSLEKKVKLGSIVK